MCARRVLHLQILPYKLERCISAAFREAPDSEVCFSQPSKGEENEGSKVQKPGSDHGCRGIKLDHQQHTRPPPTLYAEFRGGDYHKEEIIQYMSKSAYVTIPTSGVRIGVLKKAQYHCF